MANPKGKPQEWRQALSDEQVLRDITTFGISETAKKYGISERGLHGRRRRIELREGLIVRPPTRGGDVTQLDRHQAVVKYDIQDGHILIGSDSHYLPGVVTAAHRAFVEFVREYKPKAIIKNGDELDFPAISRFGMIGWESRPKVSDEIDNTKAMLSEIEKVAAGARLIWPLGNHDGRFETRLATLAPEYANVHGVHLHDHFPKWEGCWACLVNRDTVVKHRIRGGIWAKRNNTLLAGRTTVTGHLHSLGVHPHSDYNGTRWGVDCGTMADPYGRQFYNYTELNPLDWRSGFVWLTFVKGRLLWPETIWVSGPDEVQFRGKVWRV